MLRNKYSYGKQVDATYERTQISPRKLYKTGHYLTDGRLIRDTLILKRSRKSDRRHTRVFFSGVQIGITSKQELNAKISKLGLLDRDQIVPRKAQYLLESRNAG